MLLLEVGNTTKKHTLHMHIFRGLLGLGSSSGVLIPNLALRCFDSYFG